MREELKRLLLERRFDEIEMKALKDKKSLRGMMAVLYDADDLLVHRAATAWGRLALSSPASVRRFMSRLAWQLNDESGNIGRGSPLVIAEVARANMELAKEVVLVSTHFLEDRGLLKRVLWGIGRVGEVHPALVQDIIEDLKMLLADAEADIRGMAAWALGKIGAKGIESSIAPLLDDERSITIYENEIMNSVSIRSIAQKALGITGCGPAPSAA
ncbi:MAG: hypothetical protein HZA04_02410 [Nitrospinae bacterium]|nr:hypothetical protein [Nitrospinota bacterium]